MNPSINQILPLARGNYSFCVVYKQGVVFDGMANLLCPNR